MNLQQTYLYEAHSADGRQVSGSLLAADHDEARTLLASMNLTVLELREDRARPIRRPIAPRDFVLFNQQLAYLTQAGLPVEGGLRLIASEARRPRLASAVRALADDLARGRPLGEAFEARRGQFPPLYGKLIDAGVAAGNLPGMLFNIGRHLELLAQLRNTVLRATAYPLMVLMGLVFVLMLIGVVILPQFQEIFTDFDTELPWLTGAVLDAAHWLPWVLGAVLAVALLWPLTWQALKVSGVDQAVIDGLLVPLPLIGPVLRHNLVARWCDTVRLSVEAGLDLPRAIDLAGQAIGSPSLQRDGAMLNRCLADGRSLRDVGRLTLLPPTVTTTMDLAAKQNHLAEALETLTSLHRQQAETRLGLVGVFLLPIMLLALGLVVGVVVTALFMPLLKLMQSVI